MKNIKLNSIDEYWHIDSGNLTTSRTKPNSNYIKLNFYNDSTIIYYELQLYNKNDIISVSHEVSFKRDKYDEREITYVLHNSMYKLLKDNIRNDIATYKIHTPKQKILSRYSHNETFI